MYPPCNDAFSVTNSNLTKGKLMPKDASKEKNTYVSIGLLIYIKEKKNIPISMWKCCLQNYRRVFRPPTNMISCRFTGLDVGTLKYQFKVVGWNLK